MVQRVYQTWCGGDWREWHWFLESERTVTEREAWIERRSKGERGRGTEGGRETVAVCCRRESRRQISIAHQQGSITHRQPSITHRGLNEHRRASTLHSWVGSCYGERAREKELHRAEEVETERVRERMSFSFWVRVSAFEIDIFFILSGTRL